MTLLIRKKSAFTLMKDKNLLETQPTVHLYERLSNINLFMSFIIRFSFFT
jgi:hypothetical protein